MKVNKLDIGTKIFRPVFSIVRKITIVLFKYLTIK